jgi:hypothetical protein
VAFFRSATAQQPERITCRDASANAKHCVMPHPALRGRVQNLGGCGRLLLSQTWIKSFMGVCRVDLNMGLEMR